MATPVEETAALARRRPTLEDVAKLAGVSRGTVSRVINGGLNVRPSVISSVNAAIGELHYSVNQTARNLASGRTGSVAFVISERQDHLFEDPNFGLFVRIFSRELRPLGFHLLVTAAQEREEEVFLGDYLSSGHVDGAILALPHEDEYLLGRLIESRLPLVVLGAPIGRDDADRCSWIAINDEEAAETATRYLLARCHGPVATITGPVDTSSGRFRLAGFRRALGPLFREDLVVNGDWSSTSGQEGVEELLRRAPDLGGLFVASDLMALGAMRGLRAAQRGVPRDVAVVGFDDSSASLITDPPLTTVRNPFAETALEAVRILDDLLSGRATEPSHVILPTELVVRDSA